MVKIDCYILHVKVGDTWYHWAFLFKPHPSEITEKEVAKGLEDLRDDFFNEEIEEIKVEKKTFEVEVNA
ncbi:MAG: hypothetical protein DRO12_06295 [Thermoprotei archaeon]|nr:MAG: hypothetical protein DRO12_06295 [Thermoprotei archaeon]